MGWDYYHRGCKQVGEDGIGILGNVTYTPVIMVHRPTFMPNVIEFRPLTPEIELCPSFLIYYNKLLAMSEIKLSSA